MDNPNSLSENFRKQLEEAKASSILDPAKRKKKLVLRVIRTTIYVAFYIGFWKYEWVRWTLFITIPLTLFSLFSIIALPYLLERRIKLAEKKIEQAEKFLNNNAA